TPCPFLWCTCATTSNLIWSKPTSRASTICSNLTSLIFETSDVQHSFQKPLRAANVFTEEPPHANNHLLSTTSLWSIQVSTTRALMTISSSKRCSTLGFMASYVWGRWPGRTTDIYGTTKDCF
ncbi:hypothetical protein C0991_001019, partial [Blastosporella zonata]